MPSYPCGCVWERVDEIDPETDWALDGDGNGWVRTQKCERDL